MKPVCWGCDYLVKHECVHIMGDKCDGEFYKSQSCKRCPTCGKIYTDEKDCLCAPGQKPDEEIVCTNATVLVDKQGNISWIDNDQEIVKWEE